MAPLILVMVLDLGTWLLVPADVRSAYESNPLAGSPEIAAVLKLAALLAMAALLTRVRTRPKWPLYLAAGSITAIGVLSNIGGIVWQ